MEAKTPLYEAHVALGGKIIPFAGYLMPVNYATGILKEHEAVRVSAGLFDVSHMGEILVTGEAALSFLNVLLTNDFTSMEIGDVRYSPMCYPDGGVVDDLLVYKLEKEKYLLCVNASNKDKDYAWIKEQLQTGVTVEDISDSVGQVALQGPNAEGILKKIVSEKEIPEKYYTFQENVSFGDKKVLLSRTGYTGEDGYEIYAKAEDVIAIWNALLEAGKEEGLIPCGLGCRDTLRLEAGMPLYGHELSAEITPKEAGLSMFIKKEKEDFIGKEALAPPRKRKRIGLVLKERGIAREGSEIFQGEEKIGMVTSGTSSPTLKKAIAMALVDVNAEEPFTVDVRGKRLQAEVVRLPFYKREK